MFVARNISRMNWSTYVLQDYKKTLHIQLDTADDENQSEVEFRDRNRVDRSIQRPYLPLHKIRKRLKKLIVRSGACDTEDEESEADVLASVQVDTTPIPENYRYDNQDTN